jgi:hypothetical protein
LGFLVGLGGGGGVTDIARRNPWCGSFFFNLSLSTRLACCIFLEAKSGAQGINVDAWESQTVKGKADLRSLDAGAFSRI